MFVTRETKQSEALTFTVFKGSSGNGEKMVFTQTLRKAEFHLQQGYNKGVKVA